jgi:PIN domain nuclease of toxin-antitoxin system
MATVIYLDTHVVVWLYAGEVERFPPAVAQAMEGNDLSICPIVLLELAYLQETGRLEEQPHVVLERLSRAIGLRVHEEGFAAVVQEAILHTWTRDPFDRIIVAQAGLAHTPLATKDQTILRHYRQAFWTKQLPVRGAS